MDAKLFYDDDVDALRATIQALGGPKQVGPKLWPDQTPDAAARRLSDCLNPSRADRLRPSQLLFVMKLARDAEIHIFAEYMLAEAGYQKPVPVTRGDREASLVQRMEDALGAAQQLAAQLERLKRGTQA